MDIAPVAFRFSAARGNDLRAVLGPAWAGMLVNLPYMEKGEAR